MTNINKILEHIDIAQRSLTDDNMFRACVTETLRFLLVDDIDFANELAVSRSTVNRWKNGRAVPHPAMRKPVYAALKRRALARLREKRRSEEPSSSGENPICS